MTREEIKNTPELVDFMLDKCVLADSRTKVRKRLEEVCDLAIKALEQEPCEDCISRQAAIDGADTIIARDTSGNNDVVKAMTAWKSYVEGLPSVTPQAKIGHWILVDDCERFIAKCSECGRTEDSRMIYKYPFCHCGAKMQEVEDDD
jgi:hypothetical protein